MVAHSGTPSPLHFSSPIYMRVCVCVCQCVFFFLPFSLFFSFFFFFFFLFLWLDFLGFVVSCSRRNTLEGGSYFCRVVRRLPPRRQLGFALEAVQCHHSNRPLSSLVFARSTHTQSHFSIRFSCWNWFIAAIFKQCRKLYWQKKKERKSCSSPSDRQRERERENLGRSGAPSAGWSPGVWRLCCRCDGPWWRWPPLPPLPPPSSETKASDRVSLGNRAPRRVTRPGSRLSAAMVTLMPYLESGATIPRPVDLDDTDHLIDTHRQVFFCFSSPVIIFSFWKRMFPMLQFRFFGSTIFFLGCWRDKIETCVPKVDHLKWNEDARVKCGVAGAPSAPCRPNENQRPKLSRFDWAAATTATAVLKQYKCRS